MNKDELIKALELIAFYAEVRLEQLDGEMENQDAHEANNAMYLVHEHIQELKTK